MSAHTQGRIYSVVKFAYGYLLKDGAIIRDDIVDTKDVVAANIEPVDARRLAACWNACDGMSTEAIESLDGVGTIGDLIASEQARDAVQRERDQLRADLATRESRIAAQRDEIGRLHARIGAMQDGLVDANALIKNALTERNQARAELAAARALLAVAEVVANGARISIEDASDCALTDRMRALLKSVL